MALERRRPKKGDSLLYLALIISLLRTDLTRYLAHYSHYPEVQQAVLGQSLGLQFIDTNWDGFGGPAYPHKSRLDETDLMAELGRLARRPAGPRAQQHVPLWLVTENASSSAPLQVLLQPAAAAAGSGMSGSGLPGNASSSDLSHQDIELIESLWKQNTTLLDFSSTVASTSHNTTSSAWDTSQFFDDLPEGLASAPPLRYEDDDMSLYLGPDEWQDKSVGAATTSYSQPPAYQTQSSLDLDLEGLPDCLSAPGPPVTNSSFDRPFCGAPADLYGLGDPLSTNSTGMFHDQAQGLLSYDSCAGPSNLDDMGDLTPSVFADLGFEDMDPVNLTAIEIDPNDLMADLDIHDTVSEDSALSVGSGSPSRRSWSDRHSESSDEAGAVGYSHLTPKLEPFDHGVFDMDVELSEPVPEKPHLRHDHTYAAPPGGTPHVRKMDIKVEKEPSRGSARDELMCRKLKIPFSVETIINSPVDEFNTLLRKYPLSTRQTNLIKDIRRRGKNKVAAQNCRQKKMGEVDELEVEVTALKSQREHLLQKKAALQKESTDIRQKIDIMSAEIFRTLRDENGRLYNSTQVTLEVGDDGEITVVPLSRVTRQRKESKKRRKQ